MYGLTYSLHHPRGSGGGGEGGGERRRREGGKRFGLHCLMTPGLSKHIQCHV